MKKGTESSYNTSHCKEILVWFKWEPWVALEDSQKYSKSLSFITEKTKKFRNYRIGYKNLTQLFETFDKFMLYWDPTKKMQCKCYHWK